MNLVFKNNFQTSFKKLLLESKKSKKQTGLILNTTSKKHSISPILLPVRKTSNLICLGMTISKKNQLSNFLKILMENLIIFLLMQNKNLKN